MVAPNGQFFDVCHSFACFGGELRCSTVVVQTQHGGKVFAWQVWRAFHRDVGVGVGWVADHQNAHVAAGDSVQSLALCGENLGINSQQLSTLHAWTTWT